MAAPTLTEIAKRIAAHLKRFEADPEINAERFYESRRTGRRESSGHPYYHAGAWRAGNRVKVIYVSYHDPSSLTRAEAEAYLTWLDAGNVGTFFRMQHLEAS
jgi:hypothetical protein